MKERIDKALAARGLVTTRSQGESYVRLGKVLVNGRLIKKAGFFVAPDDVLEIAQETQYVSRAGMKLESVAKKFKLDFREKIVLDVGSSTGGFTDYALRNGATRVISVDVGTEQMDKNLRRDPRVELHEKTDIRDVYVRKTGSTQAKGVLLNEAPDIILIDVSFISLRKILSHIAKNLTKPTTIIVAMCKPQFESGGQVKNSGVIKNDTERRKILKAFELWIKERFLVINKADSEVAGARGNRERFYVLQILRK